MPHLVDVKDKANAGYLSVGLLDVLRTVQPEAERLRWSLLNIWAMGTLRGGRTYRDLEHEVDDSVGGVLFSWQELWKLAGEFEDVYEIYLVGHEGQHIFRRHEDDLNIYEKATMVLELFDSSYWRIYAKDEDIIARFQESFKNVEIQDQLLSQSREGG